MAGHTKFTPDRVFSAVTHTYNTSDVFNISELKAVCLRHASTHVEDGSGMFHWRELLHSKYTELPGIRSYHDFLTVKTPSGATVMKIREKCYEGTLTNSPLRIKKGFNSQIVPSQNYLHRELTSDKMSQIELRCQRYIEASRWPQFVSATTPSIISSSSDQSQKNGGQNSKRTTRRRK